MNQTKSILTKYEKIAFEDLYEDERLTSNLFKVELLMDFRYVYSIKILIKLDQIDEDEKEIKLDYYNTKKILLDNYFLISENFSINCFIDIKESSLYSKVKLPKNSISTTLNLNLVTENNKNSVDSNITLNFIFNRSLNQEDLLFLANKYIDNILSKQTQKLELTVFFENIFFNKLSCQIGNKKLLPGITYKNKYFKKHDHHLNSIYFNPNFCYLLVNCETTVFDMIQSQFDPQQKRDLIVGNHVFTSYNQKLYLIKGIIFDVDINTMEMRYKDKKITILDYYENILKISIKNKVQHLLTLYDNSEEKSFDNSDNKILLLSELCYLSQQKLPDNLSKAEEDEVLSLVSTLKLSSNLYFYSQFISNLISAVNIEEKRKERKREKNLELETDYFNLFCLNPKPLQISYRKQEKVELEYSKYYSGNRHSLSSSDFNEQLRTKFQYEPYYECPPFPSLAIVSMDTDFPLQVELIQFIEKIKTNKNLKIAKIDQAKVLKNKKNPFIEWEKTLSKVANPSLLGIIIILPECEERELIYKFVKRFLLVSFPIPCQCIRSSTFKESTIKFIFNKIISQLSVKLSSELWAVKDMPFNDVPTMIVGIYDIFIKNNIVVSMVASYNKNFTRYYSSTKIIKDYTDDITSTNIISLLKESINHFNLCQSVYPMNIIIMRENTLQLSQVGIYQKEAESVINHFKQSDSYLKSINISFLIMKRNVNFIKFYSSKDQTLFKEEKNLIIQENITNEKTEFYLLFNNNMINTVNGFSNKTLFPYNSSYYNILVLNDNHSIFDMQNLCIKLTYVYYNSIGCFSIPAPFQYAKKLAFLVGDTLSEEDCELKPSERFFTQINSLYFI